MRHIILFTFLLCFSSGVALGQDSTGLGFKIKFKIDSTGIKHLFQEDENIQVINWEIFVDNSRYFSLKNGIYQLNFDSVTNQYEVDLSYKTIKGGKYKPNAWCPDMYLKVNFEFGSKRRGKFSKFISIYFENADGRFQKYDLQTIYLANFVGDIIKYNTGDFVEPYEVIEVKSNKTIKNVRKDEYQVRKIDKLVELETEH